MTRMQAEQRAANLNKTAPIGVHYYAIRVKSEWYVKKKDSRAPRLTFK